MKTAIILTIPIAIFMLWHAHKVDSNQTEYCFNSNGDHFISGEERCNY